ncbi:hypothetical protein NIES4071_43210 [Calothrix sp. NIES-4071]|nr:hypothetical protein NIES4071_43210 [Calothrix sp. NIES-4071]BAZ58635.1 hypothetical protein NIES4105_43140 [Calothrix sp. NIES-4105]
MATINISDLRPTGSELFSDSEGYMSELSDNELISVNGGILTSPVCAAVVSRIVSPRLTREVARYLKRPNN